MMKIEPAKPGLFQFDGPVGVVEELFPAFVSLVAEMDVDQGVVSRFGGLFDQAHAGVSWRIAALFDVAGGAGADNVLPGRFSAGAARDYVIER